METPTLHRLRDVAHRRFDPLRGSWVLLASPQKNKRPRQGQREAIARARTQAYDPKCYLCPTNPRANGALNPDYKGVFVFENDFGTVRMDEAPCDTYAFANDSHVPSLLRAEPVFGHCYVLSYSAKHHYTMSDMTPGEVLDIVDAWTTIYARHLSLDNPLRKSAAGALAGSANLHEEPSMNTSTLRHMQIFDNNGEVVGCSNAHPHGQIWVTSSMPEEPRQELAQMNKYRHENCGRQLLEDYARLELAEKERVVWQNDTFLAVCPWWAIWPFEILLLPKRQIRGLVELSATERRHFAEAILQITRIYDGLFGMTFPYISALHQAPLNATDAELDGSYLHMHFSPPLLLPDSKKFLGGFELHGELTREITPEMAADLLRRSAAQLPTSSTDARDLARRPRAMAETSSPLWRRLVGSLQWHRLWGF